jgi:hypothetical protein
MARITAKNALVAFGARDISARSNSAALSITVEAPEITCFTESTRTRATGGIGDVELTVDGFWDSAASQVDALFSSFLNASALVGFFPSNTACMAGFEFSGILTEYSPNAAVADALTTSITLSSSPPLWKAMILHNGTVQTGSAVGAGVDFGASTAGAVYASLRYFSNAGTCPWLTGSFQNSPDDSTWATLATFAQLTSGSTELIATATSAARYRRFRSEVTSGSVVCLVTSGSVAIS